MTATIDHAQMERAAAAQARAASPTVPTSPPPVGLEFLRPGSRLPISSDGVTFHVNSPALRFTEAVAPASFKEAAKQTDILLHAAAAKAAASPQAEALRSLPARISTLQARVAEDQAAADMAGQQQREALEAGADLSTLDRLEKAIEEASARLRASTDWLRHAEAAQRQASADFLVVAFDLFEQAQASGYQASAKMDRDAKTAMLEAIRGPILAYYTAQAFATNMRMLKPEALAQQILKEIR